MTGTTTADVQTADVQWQDNLPLSRQFDDVYYSREDGLAESRHVFIDGNRLVERWRSLAPGQRFTVFETGFGTGLNFLCALQLWLDIAPPRSTLHFVSVEKYPLDPGSLARAHAHFPELAALSGLLLAQYSPPLAGHHRLWLCDDRVCLTLIFDDALNGFDQLLCADHPDFRPLGPRVVDAWFLDGFAPARNPDLWSADLFDTMACLSHPHTTLATFTVARIVRAGLGDAGFTVEKAPGFGRKREMLRGQFAGALPVAPDPTAYQARPVLRNSPHQQTWHIYLPTDHPGEGPQQANGLTPQSGKEIAIIGAGIAGASTAYALARRGYKVTIYDRHGMAGPEASGNPQGILYPKLSTEDSALALFGRQALCHSLGVYQPYWRDGRQHQQCGVLVLPESERELKQLQAIARRFTTAGDFVRAVDNGSMTELAGVNLAADFGLYFPTLGWIQPADVCAWLTGTSRLVQADIQQLSYDRRCRQWRLLAADGGLVGTADQVVIANSHSASIFRQTRHLPLRPVRGQVTAIPANARSGALSAVICGAGYLAPALDGTHTLGATYGVDDLDTALRGDDHISNLSTLAATDPALPSLFDAAKTTATDLDGRAAIRCTTPDYLPLVGPVADEDEMATRFADLSRNAKADIPLPGCFYPGLWINVGHGSRGFTYGPLAAEHLAAAIASEAPTLARTLAVALNPARFIIRHIKRNQSRPR